jgi:hypothetical protein
MADRGEILFGARTPLPLPLETLAPRVPFRVLAKPVATVTTDRSLTGSEPDHTEIAADNCSRARVADWVDARCLEAREGGG